MHTNRSIFTGVLLAVIATASCSDDDVLDPSGCGEPGSGPAVVRATATAPAFPHPPGGVFRVGDRIPVVVSIEGASSVGSVTFHLRHTSTVLRPEVPATEGPFMSCDGSITSLLSEPSDNPAEVIVDLARLSGGAGASGSGTLVTISFTAISTGRAVVAFTGASVRDPESQNLPASFLGTSFSVE